MTRQVMREEKTLMDSKSATGVGTSINVEEYRHVVLLFSTDTSADLTIKFQASAAETEPTFSSARTTANHWDYVAVNDYQDGGLIAGDTGIVPAGTDDFRTLMTNTEGINWINAEITSYTAGGATVKVRGYSD